MLLFQKRFHEGLVNGTVTLTFRHWDKPRVKVGGRYRCHPIGVLEVDAVERVLVKDISEQDAERAGFASRAELLQYLGERANSSDDREVFRIALHHGGDGDRVPSALATELSPKDVEALNKKLARLDGDQPWTMQTLRAIEAQPRVAARILAKRLGRERDPFKEDVRKLKRLGLTQSFETGYELAPRGRAYLDAIGAARDAT